MRSARFLIFIGVTSLIGLGSVSPARAQQSQQQKSVPVQQAPSASQKSTAARASITPQQRADLVRRRADWFQRQRAYPFSRIPTGALQHAIDQRNAMLQKQRSRLGLAAPVIQFPGNGLWQLTGPQPTNMQAFPGLENFGFPTVSGRVTALAVDASDATGQTIYLGAAAGGIWKTTNAGVNSPTNPTWTPLTDKQPSLATGSIAVDPNNHNIIYVGTGEENFAGDSYYGAGILKSTDGGATWTQLGASLFAGAQSPVGGAKVGGIAVQPGNSNIVLAAVTYFDGGTKGGIYRSADAGASWAQVSGPNAPIGAAGTDVIFESTSVAGSTAVVYAAMGDPFGTVDNGIYKSLDSGQTWTKLAGGLPASNVGRIKLAYAASTSGAGATLYAAIANSAGSSSDLLGFFVTTNGGTAWTQLVATPNFCSGQCFFDMAVAVHPTNPQFVVVGGSAFTDNSTTLFKTSNGGTTWSTDSTAKPTDFTIGSTTVRPHVDTHALVFAPNGAAPRLYVGDDGGIWRTDDTSPGNPLWVDLNATLAIAQFYPGATPAIADENYGFGGTQDNDIQVFSGTLDWNNAPACGDGGYTAIDSNTPTTIYAGCNLTAGAKVTKSVFNGQFTPGPNPTPQPSFQPAESEITASGDTMSFIPPLVIDPNNPSSLYFGTCRIWQTFDSATTWSTFTVDFTNGATVPVTGCADADSITTIGSSPTNSGIFFAGTSNGKVWQTTSGFSWTEIDNGLLPNRHITAARPKRGDATGNIGYVTFSGFGSCVGCDGRGHVFKTINANLGAGATWADISGNLPDAPVNDIIVEHVNSADILYIATDVGVFSCPDPESATPCTNWTVIGDGLPNSPVLSLGMRRDSRILRAATHGRSMWDIQLTDAQPTPLPALSSLTPAAMIAVQSGAPATVITVTGVNFGPNTQVTFFGGFVPTGMSTAFVSTTQLTVTLPSTLLQEGNVLDLYLTDPLGASPGFLPFTVMNPIPVVSAILANPGTGVVAEPVTFTVTGTGFVSGTELNFNGFTFFGTASNGGTNLVATVSGFALTAPSAGVPVTVLNPLPGGGTAAASASFPINSNGTPEITFNPGSAFFNPGINAGTTTPVMNIQLTNSGGATLTLNGTSATKSGADPGDFTLLAPDNTQTNFGAPTCGFITGGAGTSIALGASCFFGITFGPPPATPQGFRSATLTVNDNDADVEPTLSMFGTVNGPIASVFPNPIKFGSVPKGITPLPLMNVTVDNFGSGAPALAVTSVSVLASANSADFGIAAPTNGNPACTPLAGPYMLPAGAGSFCSFGVTFNPSLINTLENATLEVTFSNGTTAKFDIPMSGTGVVPTIDSISPVIVATGGPTFTLTVNGRNYVLGSVVNINANARLTTFVSATQLLASIPATDITTAGSFAITVTNPAGGGTSEPKSLLVSQASVGTNDDFAHATDASLTPFRLTEDTSQFTTNTAGHADATPACAPGGATLSGKARSAWYKFVATATGRVVANTRESSYNTILSVWTGAPGSFASIACNNAGIAGATPEASVGFNVTNGTTYFLMVTDASASGAGGTLTFNLDFAAAAPANDDWANATVVPPAGTPYSNTVNSVLATINTGGHNDPTPSCAPAGAANGGVSNSVWYSFTPTSGTPVTADTLTSSYDTILSVWTGTPGAFTQIACNDNAGTGSAQVLQSQVTFTATASTTYYFMVSSVLGDGGTTNFHLNLTAAITTLSVSPTSVTFAAGQLINTPSAPIPVTFTNGTAAAVTISGLPTISGDFLLGTNTCTASFSVGPGLSCTVNVIFKPTATGTRNGTLTINDSGSPASFPVPLTGTGIAIDVTIAKSHVSSFNVGQTGTYSITVTNTGGAPTSGTTTVTDTLPAGMTFNSNTNSGVWTCVAGSPVSCTSSAVIAANGGVSAFNLVVNVAAAAAGTPTNTATVTTVGDTGTTNKNASDPTTVNFPLPTITTLSPTGALAGGAAFTLTVNGTNFTSSSVVKFNGTAATTTFVSVTQVTAAITAPEIATAGTFNVTVTNPTPGGGTSGNSPFTVNNPAPTATTLSPASATVGGAAFTLTVNGTNFNSSSVVTFNGTTRTTTLVSATQVTIQVTSGDIAAIGSLPLFVTNPAPGGGTSGTVHLPVTNPPPTITTISPTSATAGGAGFTLTVNGTGFVSGATVNFSGNVRTTTFVNATQVTASILAGDIATAGTFNVTATNPSPGGGTSGNASFTVNNPVPAITTLSPTSALAGGAAFTLTVNGTNFNSSSVVKFNGTVATTTFVNATLVTAAITAPEIAAAGTFNVTVTNPAPGGGTSGNSPFTVNNPGPTITTLSPTSAAKGGAAFTLTVNGTGFVSTSVVNFNGAAKTTTFVSATQVTAAILATDIVTAGNFNVTVTNPAPGGGTSANSPFAVNNPLPAITTLSPTSAIVGGAAFTLTVNGTNFVSGAVVNFNGNARTTTFVSVTQVTAAITAPDIATAGSFNVTVTNPAPGGGASGNSPFAVNNPVPAITSLSPNSAIAGGVAFTLTVNGTNFVSGAVVSFNGNARTTTFVSATQVTAAITAPDIATAGSFNVIVTNPNPGGGASGNSPFAVNNPAPTITSLNPNGATAGGAGFTLTVNGTGFLSTSVVKFGGNAKTTTFVNSTQLTAAISSSDIATVGPANVTVTNPAPGGGTTTNFVFTIASQPNPSPTLSSISPTSGVVGQSVSLNLTGTGFIAGSIVNFGANGDTGGVASNGGATLTITIPAGQLTVGGPVNVTVTNPSPGGGTSTAQTFTINNPAPTITTISPTSAIVGGAAFTLTVNGTGFVSTSVVNFNGAASTTTFVSATQLTAAITPGDIAATGSFPVTVTNSAPGGGTSASSAFAVNNPVPTITTLSPTSATAGGAAFTLTVNGTGFVSTSAVKFNGVAVTTTFVNATQVTAAITAPEIATAGTFNVTVTNAVPGGGTSGNSAFTVNNPLPTIATLAPTSALAGGAAFTLTVNGTNFNSSSVVNFNGTAATTTFVSAAQVTAAITAPEIATAGSFNVNVTNPAPGGGTSGNSLFAVNNPAPTITSLSPASALAGGAAFTLTVNGTGFVSTSAVKFNGVAATTTFVSATQVTAAITAADIATAGTFNVTVTNSAPGGGTSGNGVFTVNNPAPTITTLSPTSATKGGAAFTLTVNGTNFVSTSVVNFNGAATTTTFVSATQVTAAITVANISTAGTFNVTVTNPAPGGGTSGNSSFVVNNPVPTLTSLSPTSATVGGAAFTLAVNGTGFLTGATVTFNGNVRVTTFVSATQVTAAITVADLATGGVFNVTVTNPAPTAGPSTALTFSVGNPVPTITSLAPTSATAGGSAFTLTVNGTGFVSTSVVNFNGTTATTTFVNATQLTASIASAQIAAAGTFNVTVTNPAPGGGTSGNSPFIVNNPVPTAASLSPASATKGAAFTLTVTGTNFNSSSVINFNGAAKATTFVDGTHVKASLTASDTGTAGNFNVTVTNPAPGGGTSSAQSIQIVGVALSQDASTAGTITVNAGTAATVKIDMTTTPANAPLPSALTISCTLPMALTGATCSANPSTIPANSTSGSSTITLTAIPKPATTSTSIPFPKLGGRGPWSMTLLWLVAAALVSMLGMLGAVRQRALPLRRAPVYVVLVLLVLAAGALAGCTTSMSGPTPTPTGPSTVTVTATSADGATIPITVNINVTN